MIWGGGLGQRIRVEFFFPGQPADQFFFPPQLARNFFFLDGEAVIFFSLILFTRPPHNNQLFVPKYYVKAMLVHVQGIAAKHKVHNDFFFFQVVELIFFSSGLLS